MPKRDTPDSPVVDRDGFIPPDPPPQTQGDLPFAGLFRPGPRQIARLKGQSKPPLPPQIAPRNESSFRLDSNVAPQPATSPEIQPGKGKLKIWSLKNTGQGNRTLLPSPQLKDRANEAGSPVTLAAPAQKMSALPETVEQTFMASSSIPQPAPAKPAVEAQALAFAPLGKPIEFAVPSASMPPPPTMIDVKKVMPITNNTKADLLKPVFEAQASVSPFSVAAKLPVPSTQLPSPPPEIVNEKLAASSTINISAQVMPEVQTQASPSPYLGLATVMPVPLAAPFPGTATAIPVSSALHSVVNPTNVPEASEDQAVVYTPATPVPSMLPPLGMTTGMPVSSTVPFLGTTATMPGSSTPPSLGTPAAVPGSSALFADLFQTIAREAQLAQQVVYTPCVSTIFEGCVSQLTTFSHDNTPSWEHLVGLYFQKSGRTPVEVGYKLMSGALLKDPVPELGVWIRDLRKMDQWEKDPTNKDGWPEPEEGSIVYKLAREIELGSKQAPFEEAIRRWANGMHRNDAVNRVLRRAGYMEPLDRQMEVEIVGNIKRMPEGSEKKRKLAQLMQESPRFGMECMENMLCGS